ncbi:disease resistance protein Roq1-like isoform X2 [Apium graveolens]|uniref:disease resistance protein Roq1-like isoform X2 n=1 Tax=Apium graveolens TaxID=4045 RepID=UPI003D799CE4
MEVHAVGWLMLTTKRESDVVVFPVHSFVQCIIGCEKLSIIFEESLFQVVSANVEIFPVGLGINYQVVLESYYKILDNFHGDLLEYQAGIKTFMDDYGLPRGEDISHQLREAIRGSDVSLVIFSKNYAFSPWCLDELVEILECKPKMGKSVYPVFYDVSPSVVRNKTESFQIAFEGHEKTYFLNMEKVDKWKAALTEAANLSGYDLHNDADGYEVELIQIIVKKVLLEVNLVALNVAMEPVGIVSRLGEITQLLSLGNNEIRKIGIYGMGGIGKTTIAKALFNENFRHFEGSCFLANVREASEGHDGIVHLQEQLLSEILIVDNVRVQNEDRGVSLLMERLCSKKVLIVLDDLNNRRQFDYLAGQWNQFAEGSRIVITTRDAGLLEQIEVDKRYSVEKLDRCESLELFSRHAFKKPIPPEDYMELSEGIAYQAGGLPLALVVLGSYLFKRSMGEWRRSLSQLQQIPRNDIQKKLLISYHALGIGNLQAVFLDIACFFIGNDRDMTVTILNSCGFDSNNDITILMERCLLSVNEKNELRMHDLLRDMGRDIAHNNLPKEPWKHSRLWSCQDIFNVLDGNKGKKCIECIIPSGGVLQEDLCIRYRTRWGYKLSFKTSTFEKLHKLRLLSINKVNLSGSFTGIFEELRWLSWQACPLDCLPTDFCPKNLVFLDLQQSRFKILWNGPKSMENLKILNISNCKFLTITPDFSGLPCLEDLTLRGCLDLVEVDPSIGNLVSLVKLNLMGCLKLKCLPGSICNLTALEHLDLNRCLILEGLPSGLGNMKSLMLLSAENTALKSLPKSIGHLSELSKLLLHNCKKLRNLPRNICNLRALECLDVNYCSNLNELPNNIGNMESLGMLGAAGTKITSLPESIGHLSKLTNLLLHSCKKLRYLPASICNLRSMEILDLNNCSNLEELPNNIGNMESLRMLWAEGTKFVKLPESFGHLSELVELVLCNCRMLKNLPSSICSIKSLKRLDLGDCLSLEGLPKDIGSISGLQELRAWSTKSRNIPNSIQNLKNLEILALNWFSVLENIEADPPAVFALYTLKNLNLKDCYLYDIPDSIGCLISLQHLNLSGSHFHSLPPGLGQLINVETLTLTECKYLRKIQGLPPKLSDLYASSCTSIESLDVSKLDQLRFLYLSYCNSLVKIVGLDKLASIKRIDMAGCEKLSITFEESLFQFLSGTGERIDIYLPMRDIPHWFMNQVSDSSRLSFHGIPTLPGDSLGVMVIAWLNVGHTTDHTEPVTHSKAFKATIANDVCETNAWKPVPQSWIIFIQKNNYSESSEMVIEVKDGLGVKSIGGHLIYKQIRHPRLGTTDKQKES